MINPESDEEEPGFFKKVVTLNGLFSKKEQGTFYQLKVQLLDLNGEVEVIVESLELLPQQSEDLREAENSLLRLIRNNIA